MRSVQLVDKDEEFEFSPAGFDGTVFLLRRIPISEVDRLKRANTKRDVLREGPFIIAILKYVIKGWKGMTGKNGEPVEFDDSYIPAIPDEVCSEIAAAAHAGDIESLPMLGRAEKKVSAST